MNTDMFCVCVLGNVIMFVIIFNVKCSIYTINNKKCVCMCSSAESTLNTYCLINNH